ncbi:hypothetical protein V2G26_010223 [Clonostachys chloroleuca]
MLLLRRIARVHKHRGNILPFSQVERTSNQPIVEGLNINVEGNPEEDISGHDIGSHTPFREHDNILIQVPSRIILGTGRIILAMGRNITAIGLERLTLCSMAMIGCTFIALSLLQGFNLGFFLGASLAFHILQTSQKLER